MLAKGGEGWEHSVMRLLKDLSQVMTVREPLIRSALRLGKNYIPTRYPNGFDTGAPKECSSAFQQIPGKKDRGHLQG